MKVASITEQVLTLVNKRLGLYRHMDEVVNRYKQSRDTGTLNSGRKTLEADHRTLTNEISSLQARLKAEGSDLAEKVSLPTWHQYLTGELMGCMIYKMISAPEGLSLPAYSSFSHYPSLSAYPQVGEVQKLDGQVKELVCRSCQEAERLVAGKVKKEAYIESEKNLTSKRQEFVSRIDSLLDAL